MTNDESPSTGEDTAAARPAPSTSPAADPVEGASEGVAQSTTRKTIAVWGGIVLAILVATVGTVAAFHIRHSVYACVSQIEKDGSPSAHRRQAVAASNARQEQRPANYEKRASQSADGDQPTERPCRWPGAGADRVIAYASLDYAFLGFLATMLFGTIGVVGIYLTFSLARDELRRIRS